MAYMTPRKRYNPAQHGLEKRSTPKPKAKKAPSKPYPQSR